MMLQFEVLTLDGIEYLTVADTTNYHFHIGFRRYIKRLEDTYETV